MTVPTETCSGTRKCKKNTVQPQELFFFFKVRGFTEFIQRQKISKNLHEISFKNKRALSLLAAQHWQKPNALHCFRKDQQNYVFCFYFFKQIFFLHLKSHPSITFVSLLFVFTTGFRLFFSRFDCEMHMECSEFYAILVSPHKELLLPTRSCHPLLNCTIKGFTVPEKQSWQ